MLRRWALQRLTRLHTQNLGIRSATRRFHHVGAPANPRCRHSALAVYPHGGRTLFTSSIPPILVPPTIFVGLLLTLWTWKCFWIVVLQDKLLYLSWLPPLTRSDKIADYEAECRPIHWEEKQIRSLDGTRLAVCEGRINITPKNTVVSAPARRKKSVVICYFQGNGGSTPLRLPLLSQVLRAIRDTSSSREDGEVEVSYTIVALSYRGYWTSAGRATQRGIQLDAQAFLNWVFATYSEPDTDLQVVLWGHSLGAAVASTAAVTHFSQPSREELFRGTPASDESVLPSPPIVGLILEAPISSIKDMLISLYPQKWLPYRYLWPLSWNNWNVPRALEELSALRNRSSGVPPIFLLSPKEDEVIPPWVADELEQKGKDLRLVIERKDVAGAMHIEAPLKVDGRKALVNFILKQSTSQQKPASRNYVTDRSR